MSNIDLSATGDSNTSRDFTTAALITIDAQRDTLEASLAVSFAAC